MFKLLSYDLVRCDLIGMVEKKNNFMYVATGCYLYSDVLLLDVIFISMIVHFFHPSMPSILFSCKVNVLSSQKSECSSVKVSPINISDMLNEYFAPSKCTFS